MTAPATFQLEPRIRRIVALADHADALGIDPSRISIGGESAGGNLADPLRDDGRVYVEALSAAGVTVEHVHLAGHVHPSFAFTRLVRSAAADERAAIATLARALHGAPT